MAATLQAWKIKFKRTKHPSLHINKSAKIIINKKTIGIIGFINPIIAKKIDITKKTCIFEIIINNNINKITKFSKISKFQLHKRDISLIINIKIFIGKLINYIKKYCINYNVIKIKLIDIYNFKNFKNIKSITLRFYLQNINKTFKEQQLCKIIQKCIKIIKKKYKISVRIT